MVILGTIFLQRSYIPGGWYLKIHVDSLYCKSVLKDCLIDHQNMVSQDRWSLVTGLITLKYRTFCQTVVLLQDRWSHGSSLSRQVSLFHDYMVIRVIGIIKMHA